MIDFVGFRKIPRLSRRCIITEKIDGTNGQIYIAESSVPGQTVPIVLKSGEEVPFLVGSRTRWIFPESDNFGFANWAYENAEDLLRLGPGHHFGEWWGSGIQRGYGLKERKFSLFNTTKWFGEPSKPECCDVVPVLYTGDFNDFAWDHSLSELMRLGSVASPGFMDPEGIVVYHVAGNYMFKKTLKDDSQKGGPVS